jgi:hypothetical protein
VRRRGTRVSALDNQNKVVGKIDRRTGIITTYARTGQDHPRGLCRLCQTARLNRGLSKLCGREERARFQDYSVHTLPRCYAIAVPP